MRTAVKRLVERLLIGSGWARASRRLKRNSAVVLAFHNIVPAGERAVGDRSLHLPQETFALLLDRLGETHAVVRLQDLVSGRATANGPLAAVTFDDAYQGAVTAGVSELAARAMPATIFAAPGMLGGRSFWWDELVDDDGLLPPALRATALDALGGHQREVRDWAAWNGRPARSLPPHSRTATEETLRSAAGVGGITVGSHSWSHPNLARLGPRELEAELRRPLEWLSEALPGAAVRFLAYPYGLSSPAVERAARELYEGAFLIEGGLGSRADLERRRHRLPRLNVPAGVSGDGFELRASGAWP